ncbi:hypothetical protein ACFYNN_24675 [Streptomyces sp. NPDC006978]
MNRLTATAISVSQGLPRLPRGTSGGLLSGRAEGSTVVEDMREPCL